MMNTPPLNEELQRLQVHLSQRDDVLLAIAFGSVARGQARFDSDLDLTIDLGRELTPDDKLALMSDLAELTGRLAHGKRLVGSNIRYAQADFLPPRNRLLKERRERWIGR